MTGRAVVVAVVVTVCAAGDVVWLGASVWVSRGELVLAVPIPEERPCELFAPQAIIASVAPTVRHTANVNFRIPDIFFISVFPFTVLIPLLYNIRPCLSTFPHQLPHSNFFDYNVFGFTTGLYVRIDSNIQSKTSESYFFTNSSTVIVLYCSSPNKFSTIVSYHSSFKA